MDYLLVKFKCDTIWNVVLVVSSQHMLFRSIITAKIVS